MGPFTSPLEGSGLQNPKLGEKMNIKSKLTISRTRAHQKDG